MSIGFGDVISTAINSLRVMLFTWNGSFALGILAFFGLTWGVHRVIMTPSIGFIQNLMGGGPGGEFGATAIAWMGVLRFDVAVSMIVGALVARAAISAAKAALSVATAAA